jgi:radical SAM superfamily enzyme YgiQ (UPF0313 family)
MGIQMIAAVLENAGYDVYLLDANAARKRLSIEEIVQTAHQLKPDIIGMTLLTQLARESYMLVSHLKSTNAKFIAGGPHATILPDEAIKNGFDAVVLGEGEATVEEAVKALLGQMPKDDVLGWVYKDDKGLPIHTKERPLITNLDNLPLPARHLVNARDYGLENNGKIHAMIFSSRGCPSRCAFCSGGLFGKKFRFRSAQNILDEIMYLHKTYNMKHFDFVDDAMTIDRTRVKQFCEKLIECNLPITWRVMTRIDAVDEELLTWLANAKCTEIHFGVESGDPETLRKIHKPHTVEMVQRIIPMVAKLKFKIVVFFIFGFPWEDRKSIENTSRLMHELAPYVDFHPAIASILIPFPGTEIYEKYKNEYHFENWWLREDNTHSDKNISMRPYYDKRLFSVGNVLDFDFFHYSKEMKQKIHDLFVLMTKQNHKKFPHPQGYILMTMINLSKKSYSISPKLENILFLPFKMLSQLNGNGK